MDGQEGKWICGYVDGYVSECMDEQMDGLVLNKCTDSGYKLVCRQIDRWMDGWNGWFTK